MAAFDAKLLRVRDHREKLQAQLEYEEARDFEAPLKAAIDKVKALKADIKAGEERLAGLAEREGELRAAMAEADAALAAAKVHTLYLSRYAV